MENDSDLTITRIAPLIRRKKISPVELTEFFLERISRLQPAINAYITVCEELAMAQARRAERELANGKYRGALHGIPISLKDLFYTRGIRTTGGSRILKNFVPRENAAVVDRLLQAGCILLGKTNLHEFAYGATNINPHYGPVRNPWDTERISGGSSGGSAASVVSAQALASLGTDTGGSIRIPSAACGCVGLKPSYGLVPLDGIIPLSGSLDHAGPLCRCVADAVLLFDVVSAPEGRASMPRQTATRGLRDGVKSLRIGVPRQYFFDRIQPDVRMAVLAAVAVFRQLGARIREVDMKGMEETARLAADITAGEALAYHAEWLRRRPGDYGRDVRSRLEQSRELMASAYIQAMQKRAAYSGRMERVLESVDILLAPTLPVVAPRIDAEQVRAGRARRDVRLALLSLTRPANLSGLPALSVPCGFSRGGIPVGLQLIGRRRKEGTLFRAAYAYEQATSWHLQFPPDPV
jgi:aspartyl-tRNA(Asn)/glutamyl-tRNA(Gln) amidotransferase subunit A